MNISYSARTSGAEPLPVVAAGVCCQNSSIGGAGQMGIPMEKNAGIYRKHTEPHRMG